MLSLLCLIKHSTQSCTHPSPSRLIVIDVKTDNKNKDIILHGRHVQGKGPQQITNKGQVVIPKWPQVQEKNTLSVIDWINQFYSFLLAFY